MAAFGVVPNAFAQQPVLVPPTVEAGTDPFRGGLTVSEVEAATGVDLPAPKREDIRLYGERISPEMMARGSWPYRALRNTINSRFEITAHFEDGKVVFRPERELSPLERDLFEGRDSEAAMAAAFLRHGTPDEHGWMSLEGLAPRLDTQRNHPITKRGESVIVRDDRLVALVGCPLPGELPAGTCLINYGSDALGVQMWLWVDEPLFRARPDVVDLIGQTLVARALSASPRSDGQGTAAPAGEQRGMLQ